MVSLKTKFLAATIGLASLVTGGYGLKEYLHFEGTISEGYREGVVDKLSYKGFGSVVKDLATFGQCKSWEGQLAMQGTMKDENGNITNTFNFSVTDPAIVDKLNSIPAGDNRIAKLHYHQTEDHLFCFRKTNYKIVDVEFSEPRTQSMYSQPAPVVVQSAPVRQPLQRGK